MKPINKIVIHSVILSYGWNHSKNTLLLFLLKTPLEPLWKPLGYCTIHCKTLNGKMSVCRIYVCRFRGKSDPETGIKIPRNIQFSQWWSWLLRSYKGISIEWKVFCNQFKIPCSFINRSFMFWFFYHSEDVDEGVKGSSVGFRVPHWLPGVLEEFSGQGELLGALPEMTLAKTLCGNTERKTRDDLSEINLTSWWTVWLRIWPPDPYLKPALSFGRWWQSNNAVHEHGVNIWEGRMCMEVSVEQAGRKDFRGSVLGKSVFPGVSEPGGHSSFLKVESFYSSTHPGSFSKSSSRTVLPAGWIFRKGSLA